jgi:very-short-patch-repair endonuclease
VRTQPSFDGVGDVDLLVEGWVVIECDGYEYHSGRAEFAKDRRRDRILHAGGLVVLRFTYVDIVTDPGCVVRAVRAVLAARAAGGLLRPVG